MDVLLLKRSPEACEYFLNTLTELDEVTKSLHRRCLLLHSRLLSLLLDMEYSQTSLWCTLSMACPHRRGKGGDDRIEHQTDHKRVRM